MPSKFWNTIRVVVVLQALYLAIAKEEDEPGFNLFFQTNNQELLDEPISFDHPLPYWLNGTLIRNGLGRLEFGKRRFTHTFDGFAKLSSWKFRGNDTAYFSTKFIKSDFYKKSVAKNDIASYLMFESVEPPFSEFQKLECLVRGIDNMNVNVYRFSLNDTHKDFVALNDYWKVYQFNSSTLETLRPIWAPVPHRKQHGGIGFLNFLSSSHPLPEHGTKNHFTFVSSVSLVPWVQSKISLIRIKTTTNRELVAEWKVKQVPYMHSFSVTENYVIFFASPFYVNVLKMLKYARPIDGLDWHPDEPTIVYLVTIATGRVQTFHMPAVFAMHHVNAFEKGKNTIFVDVSAYDNPSFVKNLEIDTLRDPVKRNAFNPHAALRRYIFDIKRNQVTEKLFSGQNSVVPCAAKLDMPTINEKYRYQKYCFVYGIVLKWDDKLFSRIALVKKDLCSGKKDKMWFIPHHYPVEAWFVPFQEEGVPLQEDDGYLLLPVLDGKKSKSYLAVIDARTMNLVNKAYLPIHVPYSLHGRFFSD